MWIYFLPKESKASTSIRQTPAVYWQQTVFLFPEPVIPPRPPGERKGRGRRSVSEESLTSLYTVTGLDETHILFKCNQPDDASQTTARTTPFTIRHQRVFVVMQYLVLVSLEKRNIHCKWFYCYHYREPFFATSICLSAYLFMSVCMYLFYYFWV